MSQKKQLLIVDDEVSILEVFREIFLTADFEVVTFEDPTKGLEYALENGDNIFAAAVDYKMPVMTGLELIQGIKKKYPNLPCFLVSAFVGTDFDPDTEGVDKVFRKPMQIGPFKKEVLDTYNKLKS